MKDLTTDKGVTSTSRKVPWNQPDILRLLPPGHVCLLVCPVLNPRLLLDIKIPKEVGDNQLHFRIRQARLISLVPSSQNVALQ